VACALANRWHAISRLGAMAEVDPDQEAALRRLRAAFGSIEILWIVDHNNGQDQNDEPIQEGEQALPADPQCQSAGGALRR
jgi:hypothetical protein